MVFVYKMCMCVRVCVCVFIYNMWAARDGVRHHLVTLHGMERWQHEGKGLTVVQFVEQVLCIN